MIPTLFDYLQSNPSPLPTEVQENGLIKYLCPNCNSWKWAGVIVDVRSLPIIEEWACDGCWSDWERHGRNIDGGEKNPEDTREWKLRWALAHGVDAPKIQQLSMARRPDKYKKR